MPEQNAYQPVSINVYRTGSRLTIAALMPGIEPENISVEITSDGRLVLEGTLRGELKGIKEQLLEEWRAGSYRREYTLPNAVDGSMANITYGNGVVVIALPLADQIRPARLTVETLTPTRGERAGNAGHPVRPTSRAS